jgi:phosphocarrier protein
MFMKKGAPPFFLFIEIQFKKMNTERSELSRSIAIVNDLGLHARAAAKLAELAQKASGGVWVSNGIETADATSVVDLLTLACFKGTPVTVRIDSAADIDILNRIAALVENGFGE